MFTGSFWLLSTHPQIRRISADLRPNVDVRNTVKLTTLLGPIIGVTVPSWSIEPRRVTTPIEHLTGPAERCSLRFRPREGGLPRARAPAIRLRAEGRWAGVSGFLSESHRRPRPRPPPPRPASGVIGAEPRGRRTPRPGGLRPRRGVLRRRGA